MGLRFAVQLWLNMGTRYVLYRCFYELEVKFGRLKKRHPAELDVKLAISLNEWRLIKNGFAIGAKTELNFCKRPTEILKQNAKKILSGELQYFNAKWIHIGRNYDWLTNPSNGYRYNTNQHWSEIPDLSLEAGDIKYVWEKSRFTYLLTLIRYDYHFEIDLSEFVFEEIDSWIQANPINYGPNWRCSQEISLRIFNWCYALYYYQNSAAFTEERWRRIQRIIFASLHHVYNHINFSRIAVRNNHAITETLFLALSNILFPFIPETKKWSQDGLKWLEREVDYQIYNDGTFLQFSMNYHRVVVQLFSFGISIFEKNEQRLSDIFYAKAYKSLNFLYQCVQDEHGRVPNYGFNDGALFFPLTDSDYRDFRPQLNTLHLILTGKELYVNDEIQEDYHWLNSEVALFKFQAISKIQGIQSFKFGGYYLCRIDDFLIFIRCGMHKDRPAQADNLHLDIWYKDKNVLRDSGTYQYNAAKEITNYFNSSLAHNTVMIEDYSQMQKWGRFIWFYWSQAREASWSQTESSFIFSGSISAFRQLNYLAQHKRVVEISKTELKVLVKDRVKGLDRYLKKQVWHPNSDNLKIKSSGRTPIDFRSFNSDYYGLIEAKESLFFEFKDSIETNLEIVLK